MTISNEFRYLFVEDFWRMQSCEKLFTKTTKVVKLMKDEPRRHQIGLAITPRRLQTPGNYEEEAIIAKYSCGLLVIKAAWSSYFRWDTRDQIRGIIGEYYNQVQPMGYYTDYEPAIYQRKNESP